MRVAYVKKFLATLALTSALLSAQEKLPDEHASLSTQTPVTPTSLPGAETHFYRTGAPAPMRLFVFKPVGWIAQDRRPALIHFFGGGFTHGVPTQAIGWAKNAAQLGLIGIVADYRVKERFSTDATACVADARAAVRWLQTHADELGLDPARLVVSGSSAGGHLALWTAITATPTGGDPSEAPLQKPAALILMSPACDSSVATGQRAERFGLNPDAYSPQQHLDAKMPPTLLFHGDADLIVPFKYAVALEAKLRATGNACEFIPMPGGGHGFTLPAWKEEAPKRITAFLRRHNLVP
ncbi:MAG: alpha/beta hydrolase [Opitutaceae bacterium]|jgi:acetyl esterase/lipase